MGLDIKDQFLVSEIVERLGIELIPQSGGYRADCPFCGSFRTFYVNDKQKRCGCYQAGCYLSLDAVDLVEKHLNKTFVEALEWIKGNEVAMRENRGRQKKTKAPDKPRVDPMQMFLAGQHGAQLAKSYFGGRGLSPESIEKFQLGAIEKYQAGWHKTKSGVWIKRVPHIRYTIPWMLHGELRAVALRIDYNNALESARTLSVSDKRELKKDFDTRGIAWEAEKIVEIIAGPKYLTAGNKTNRVFNADSITEVGDDKKVKAIEVDVVVVTEGEINAIGIQEVTGIPSLAIKSHQDLQRVLEKVKRIVVMQDNDKPKQGPSGVFVPGEEYVKGIIKKTGRHDIVVIKTPDPHNDAMDFIKNDRDGFASFMEEKINDHKS